MNTAPDKAKGDKSEIPNKTRIDDMEEQGIQPEMPPCDAMHLVGYLFDIGPTMAGVMGDGPLTHGEIESWQFNSGVELDAWESGTLRRLSIAYHNEKSASKDPICPAPYNHEEVIENRRDVVSSQFKTLIANSKVDKG